MGLGVRIRAGDAGLVRPDPVSRASVGDGDMAPHVLNLDTAMFPGLLGGGLPDDGTVDLLPVLLAVPGLELAELTVLGAPPIEMLRLPARHYR